MSPISKSRRGKGHLGLPDQKDGQAPVTFLTSEERKTKPMSILKAALDIDATKESGNSTTLQSNATDTTTSNLIVNNTVTSNTTDITLSTTNSTNTLGNNITNASVSSSNTTAINTTSITTESVLAPTASLLSAAFNSTSTSTVSPAAPATSPGNGFTMVFKPPKTSDDGFKGMISSLNKAFWFFLKLTFQLPPPISSLNPI
jgi:hypothetical protein